MAKNLVLGLILTHLAQKCFSFFSKIWLRQSLNVMVSYHHVQYQKKTNDPILRKLSPGGTDGQTDRQTDKSYFIGCCPTNNEHPIPDKSFKLSCFSCISTKNTLK